MDVELVRPDKGDVAMKVGEEMHGLNIQRNDRPVRERVRDALQTAIADGRLLPGSRLSERKLCTAFGVSRPVLREAVRQLEADELVESTPQRGTFVSSPSLADALEIYEVRIELEALAARLAARLCDDTDLRALSDALDAIGAVAQSKDLAAIVSAKTLFYEKLVAAARNTVLQGSLTRLRNRILLYRGVALNEQGRTATALRELQDIYAAIEERDAALAEKMSRRHIGEAAWRLAIALSRKEDRALTASEQERLSLLGAGDREPQSSVKDTTKGAET